MALRRMRSPRLGRAAAALVLAPALLLAAGCGGGSEPASSSGQPITLGFSAWPGWFPWQVAEERGLFEQNGVDVELKYFDSYTDSLNALATGNVDANSQTLNDTLASVSGGAEQKVVLVNDNSTGNDQIIAAKGIDEVADLAGKKVAAEQGTVDHYLLLLALERAGLTEDDIELTPLPTDAAAAAFVAGQVDAVGVFAPFTTTALDRPGSSVIASSADFPGAIPDHLVVSAQLVEQRPDDVRALVATWFDTLAWIEDNPRDATALMAARAGVTPEDYASYDAGTTIFTLEQNIEAFTPGDSATSLDRQARDIAAFLVESGLADNEPRVDDLFASRFVELVAEESAEETR